LSEFVCLEDVETFCSKKRQQVLVTLRATEKPKGGVITGEPESCNSENGCSKGALCLLNSDRITTARRKSH
jgi:hypothetical protein